MPSPRARILSFSLALAGLGVVMPRVGPLQAKSEEDLGLPPPAPTAETDYALYSIRRDIDELDKLMPRKMRERGQALNRVREYPEYLRELRTRFSSLSHALWDYELRHPEYSFWLEAYKSTFSARLSLVTGVLGTEERDFHFNPVFSDSSASMLEVPRRKLADDATIKFFGQHQRAAEMKYWEQAAHYLATQEFEVVGNSASSAVPTAGAAVAPKNAEQVLAETSRSIQQLGRDYRKFEIPRAVMELVTTPNEFLVLRSYLATRLESPHTADWIKFAELLQTVKDEKSSRFVSTLLVNRGWTLPDVVKISKDARERGMHTALRESAAISANARQRAMESLNLFYPEEFRDAFTCAVGYARVKAPASPARPRLPK